MKLLLMLVASALAVSTAPELAIATHSGGTNAPPYDFVHGTVHLDEPGFGSFNHHVDARSGPSGESPRGHFWVRSSVEIFPRELDFSGRVTCLNVQGNRATVGGEITKTKEPSPAVGPGVLMYVVDNGEPGDGDQSLAFFLVPVVPTVCPPPGQSFPFAGGNYVVHDALP